MQNLSAAGIIVFWSISINIFKYAYVVNLWFVNIPGCNTMVICKDGRQMWSEGFILFYFTCNHMYKRNKNVFATENLS